MKAQFDFEMRYTDWISDLRPSEKYSFSSPTEVAGGRFPTHKPLPDFFGLRGGPRGREGVLVLLDAGDAAEDKSEGSDLFAGRFERAGEG